MLCQKIRRAIRAIVNKVVRNKLQDVGMTMIGAPVAVREIRVAVKVLAKRAANKVTARN